MGAILTDYQHPDSPLSTNEGHFGVLRAGMRMPDLPVSVRSKLGKVQPAKSARLLSPLNLSEFTLLHINAADAGESSVFLQESLSARSDLIDVYDVSPVEESGGKKHFVDQFGAAFSLVLVRRDSYIGFTGGRNSGPKLRDYYISRSG